MKRSTPTKQMHFGDFFAEVVNHGLDEIEAATALLVELKGDLRAWGRRRRFEETEHLPRDLHPQPVPVWLWRMLKDVNGKCEAFWQDEEDPERIPHQWIEVDFVSGFVNYLMYEDDWAHVKTTFHALTLDERSAVKILLGLAGKQPKRPGAKAGPRSQSDREKLAAALVRLDSGEPVTAWQLAGEMVDLATPEAEFETLRKRYYGQLNRARRHSQN